MDNPRPSGSSSLSSRVHALVERYTPDGALGRFLLGSTTGSLGLWLLALVSFEIPRWGLSLAALFWTPVLLGFGLPLVLLSFLTLWPIYLSLIGNIDSAADYPVGGANDSQTTESFSTTATNASARAGLDRSAGETPSGADERDPFGDLKAKYENGELTEDEFERRLEKRLANGEYTVRSDAVKEREHSFRSRDESTGERRERSPERQ